MGFASPVPCGVWGDLLDAPLSEPSALPGPGCLSLTESDSRPRPAAPTESVPDAASKGSWDRADINKGADPGVDPSGGR